MVGLRFEVCQEMFDEMAVELIKFLPFHYSPQYSLSVEEEYAIVAVASSSSYVYCSPEHMPVLSPPHGTTKIKDKEVKNAAAGTLLLGG
jgi:hypothetical protein